MNLLTSAFKYHNSKFFFSKYELTKILNCYSLGVSKGQWRDYAIFYGKKETSFYMFKHSLASPDYTLTKTNKHKKNDVIYNLKFQNNKVSKFNKIEDLLALLNRNELKIIQY